MRNLLLWLAMTFTVILSIQALQTDPHPLVVQAKVDDMCDVPFRERPPLLDSPPHGRAYRIRPYNDRGIA